MKRGRCCGASPQCARCPLRLHPERGGGGLVEAILGGATRRPLPPSVRRTLDALDEARRRAGARAGASPPDGD